MRRPRVLMVSKFEQVQGGVEVHIRDLRAGLEDDGWETEMFSVEDLPSSTEKFDAAAAGASARLSSVRTLLWNSRAREAIRDAVHAFRPDIIHYHSIYHQLSPSVLNVSDTPAIMTLHDFKLVAPCYTLVRDGTYCDLCVDSRTNADAIRYRCVKNSRAASAICAAETAVYQDRYVENVGKFIVPSSFAESIFVRGGISSEKLSVIPWGVKLPPSQAGGLAGGNERYWIFTGRLHPAKGVVQLLAAWKNCERPSDIRLVIAGDGELRRFVDDYARSDPSVTSMGFVERDELMNLMASAEACLVPSVQPETMGLSAIEALVARVPLISSGAGALSDLAGPGVVNLGTDSHLWARTLTKLAMDPSLINAERGLLAARDLNAFDHREMSRRVAAVYNSAISDRM